MLRVLLTLLIAVPLFAQLPPGVSRVSYNRTLSDGAFFAATSNDVLWVGGIADDDVARVELDGAVQNIKLPPIWRGSRGMTAGPDGALWLGGVGWVARIDPVTSALQRFAIGTNNNASNLRPGAEGTIWFKMNESVVRMRSDGTFIFSTPVGFGTGGAAVGDDGAFYVAAATTRSSPQTLDGLIRVTLDGEQTVAPASLRGSLFAGRNMLWSGSRSNAPEGPPAGEILKLSYEGETLDTYRIDMEPIASDRDGNLWLRSTTSEGDIVGRLTPAGVLTRFGPLPALPSNSCNQRYYGGAAFLSGGSVAVSDYYLFAPRGLGGPCAGVPYDFQNTITILDPRIVPVLSVESLEPPTRRRRARR